MIILTPFSQTQYGNILRIRPDDEKSPLMQPANEHKQLIVIDFEYSAANVRGLEFANHFSEWAYNYHDQAAPYACNVERYPTLEQQHRFIRAYVDHRTPFLHGNAGGGVSTPRLAPHDAMGSGAGTPNLVSVSSSSSIAEFMLDARAPPGGWKEEERRHEEQMDVRVKELMDETRLWRAGNSAQWVAWGIVQAKLAGFEAEESEKSGQPESEKMDEEQADGGGEEEEAEEGEGEEFDYLAYAQERAMFFWGDCVLLGLLKMEELPEGVKSRAKFVER
jgi:choline kinase